jgi:hypothetical protein
VCGPEFKLQYHQKTKESPKNQTGWGHESNRNCLESTRPRFNPQLSPKQIKTKKPKK